MPRPVLMGLGIVALTAVGGLAPLVGQAKEGCTLESLSGEYGARQTGVVLVNGTKADLAVVSRIVFDGHGKFSATNTESFNGAIARNQTSTGTYTMSPDCTGSDTGKELIGFVFHDDFVLVDHGKQVFVINTDPGAVLSGTAIKQD